MQVKTLVAVICVVAAVGAGLTVADDGADGSDREVRSAGEDKLEEDRRKVRLFAFSTTTSIKMLAITTMTAISTCLSVVTTAVCNGRKKRALFNDLTALDDDMPEVTDLHGSKVGEEELETLDRGGRVEDGEEGEKNEEEDEEAIRKRVLDGRDGRKLTIWSSFISTLTITSTSYLTGTTVTATAFCSAPGLMPSCFGK